MATVETGRSIFGGAMPFDSKTVLGGYDPQAQNFDKVQSAEAKRIEEEQRRAFLESIRAQMAGRGQGVQQLTQGYRQALGAVGGMSAPSQNAGMFSRNIQNQRAAMGGQFQNALSNMQAMEAQSAQQALQNYLAQKYQDVNARNQMRMQDQMNINQILAQQDMANAQAQTKEGLHGNILGAAGGFVGGILGG